MATRVRRRRRAVRRWSRRGMVALEALTRLRGQGVSGVRGSGHQEGEEGEEDVGSVQEDYGVTPRVHYITYRYLR